ncbi:hypothetical protein AB4347_21315, partial [Vibrio breoganii]
LMVRTDFDNAYQSATLSCNVALENLAAATNATLEYALLDGSQVISQGSVDNLTVPNQQTGGNANTQFSIDVVNPVQWNAENPYLY